MDVENIAAIFAAAAKRHTVLLPRVSSPSTSEAVLNQEAAAIVRWGLLALKQKLIG